MTRHRSLVTAETSEDGSRVTIGIRCDSCEGGAFEIARAHLATLTKVLPEFCKAAGIDLEDGVMEARVFDMNNEETRRQAEAFYQAFVKRRTNGETH